MQTDVDIVLDDLCRMDFVSYFPALKTLTLINQGITDIEVYSIYSTFIRA